MQRVTVVPAGQSPRRLDVFVTTQSARLSRAVAQRWIEGGLITVNDRRAKAAQRIHPGDVIACHVAERAALPVEPEPFQPPKGCTPGHAPVVAPARRLTYSTPASMPSRKR